ncbi:MAG: thiol:disulfide interchange protein DsbD [Candidatus Neomarinimicrobiota bacterium]|nr:MAG: thiol:disulfide interchange protein DsbD [Candidatus Neomarinimicrobiota bacterium]|tara:strand:- start:3486 stop:5282 length:1797 start_codon:yes stop_codon:yes gene_type:complete
MKKLLLLFYCSMLFGQQFDDPANFRFSIDDVRQGEVALITLDTELEYGWHIYAIYDVPDGPESTTMRVEGSIVDQVGRIIEPKPIEAFDEGFMIITKYHKNKPQFKIPVQINDDTPLGSYSLKSTVRYQVCNEGLCYPPNEYTQDIKFNVVDGPIRNEYAVVNFDFDKKSILDITDNKVGSFLLLSLSMGFLALLTPCVFPMIPITISFFLKRGEDKNTSPVKGALVYMFGIVMTFTLLGMLLAIFLGASGATQLASNPYVNLFIAALFIYFAFSLFGFYEIDLPQSLKRFSLQRENSEGYAGILFMALTFTLTSFTCTVAFMGLILVAASQGEWFWPIIGMLIFSLAFASPFFLLALFPHYLTKMPQSGSWLNSVKVIMGFLEIAAAFKFISNTDLVWQWDIFTYEVVLICWAIIMALCSLYIVGYIRFKNDSKIEFSYQRSLLSIIFFALSLYLLSGNFGYRINGTIESYLPPKKEYSNLNWVNSLEQGFQLAKQDNRNIFIDFTGVTCTNCRWMETNIFTQQSVEQLMEQFVLVSLYTDAGDNYLEKRQYQIDRFETAALPYYVILDKEDSIIAEFPGMSRNVDDFIEFLESGLD